MSDQVSQPEVVIANRAAGGHVALVHFGNKVRQIFADGLDSLRTQLSAVGISEFGMEQEASRAFAADTVGKHADAADGQSSATEEMNLLREQLTEDQAKIDELAASLAERDGKIETLVKLIADLRGMAAGTSIEAKYAPPTETEAGASQGGDGPAAATGTDEPAKEA